MFAPPRTFSRVTRYYQLVTRRPLGFQIGARPADRLGLGLEFLSFR